MTTLSIDTNELIVQAYSLSDQANLSASERSGANEKVAWLKEGLKTFFDKHNATRTKLETLLTNVNGSINMKNAEVSCLQDAAKEASKNLQKAVAALKKADDNYKKLEDKSISQTQEQSKAEAGHKKAEKAMGQAYDNYMSAKNELENLQGIVPKIQAEIDETNRQLGQGLKSYAGLNNYSATDLSCMALIIRAGTLGSNIRQFAQDSQNADSQTAGLLEQQYLNNLPDNNFWEKQSGKDLIAYFNSGDK